MEPVHMALMWYDDQHSATGFGWVPRARSSHCGHDGLIVMPRCRQKGRAGGLACSNGGEKCATVDLGLQGCLRAAPSVASHIFYGSQRPVQIRPILSASE